MVFLEPQEKIWGPGQSGRMFSLRDLSNSDNVNSLNGIAEFDSRTKLYPKTLFRFPLRSTASGLSQNLYTIEKVNQLINALKSEAKLLLLFLRSIHTVEVYHIDSYGQQTLSFQTKIADSFVHELSEKRASLLSQLRSSHARQQYNFSDVFRFTAKFDVCVCDAKTRLTTTSHWFVANQVGSSNAAVRQASVKQKVFPWVGTAVELDSPRDGRIFCFLPMPIETASNLPVHVNGTFGLNDDRRSLKWPGIERRNDTMANWNEMLVKDVLPSCYGRLLSNVKQHLSSTDFYKAWPCVQQLRHSQWKALLTPVFDIIMKYQVIFSKHVGYSGEWVNPLVAVYKPREGQLNEVVTTVLSKSGVKLAKVPANVWSAFDHACMSATEVSPSFVRDKLRANQGSYDCITSTDKLELLRYCMSDEPYDGDELVDLQLLPLADGTFTAFEDESSCVYVCTSECPKYLLPGLSHKLVDISGDLHTCLVQLAQSDTTQLVELDVNTVARLLDEVLPARWRRNGKGTLPSVHITSDWLEKFWKWMKKKQLQIFQNKVILPVHCANISPTRKFSIVKLAASQPVLYIPYYSECSATMFSVLDKFEVSYCTQASFPYVVHSQLSDFIKTYSPSALLGVIALKDDYKSVQLTLEQAECLRNTFAESRRLTSNDKVVLRNLPIFSSCKNTKRSLYSISEAAKKSVWKQSLRPAKTIDLSVLPPNIVIFSSAEYYQNQLLNRLGCDTCDGVEFLTRYMFPYLNALGDSYIDGIMTKVLDMYQTLRYNDSSITSSLETLAFVEVSSGARKCPSVLFDPTNEDIAEIFCGENVFPVAPYNKQAYISVLKYCGLRTRVNPQEILDVIFSVAAQASSLPKKVDAVRILRAKAVMKYIQSSTFRYQISGSYKSKICGGNFSFDSALMLLCRHRSWLPVLAERPSYYPAGLSWKGADYTSHFVTLSASVCVMHTDSSSLPLKYGSQAFFIASFDSVASNEPKACLVPHFKHVIACKDQLDADDMLMTLHAIYGEMQKIVRERTDVHHLDALKRIKNWVYMKEHEKFVGIASVAMKQNPAFRHNVEPYLHTLPDSISNYSALFRHFGMNDTFSQSQIVSILSLIEGEMSNPSIGDEEAWSIVMVVLNWLTKDGTKDLPLKSIYVPADSDSSWPDLRDSQDLVFTDNEFLKNFAPEAESDYILTFVHSRVNQSLAKALRIKPLSEELDISEDTFEDAGQHEPLVVRLKNILRDYKDGLTIIKELLQNADDAEASEVNICFDARSHTTERRKLFFPDMCEAHGPALIVHNNSTFSDEDFANITKLAGATKQGKHLKIGKFGIGFCSVYHITDVPSFVSRDRLYIFDPTLKHLEKAVKNPAQPGKRVNYLSNAIKRSRQMEPYEGLFKFNSRAKYNGTMFRLPFRTCPSELSSTCYSSSTITDLVKRIQDCGDKLLLFLQHVKHITVQQIDSFSGVPEVLFELHKPALASPSVLLSIVVIESQSTRDDKRTNNSWMITKHVTTCDQKTAVANVAFLMRSTGNTFTVEEDFEGEVFCFLPLSQSTGLPVHVSCNFAVINNRRGIWTSHEAVHSFDPEVQWNIHLMENVIPQAYIELLNNLSAMQRSGRLQDYSFHSLWPLSSELEQKNPWERFVESFYRLLPSEKLFYSVSTRKWLTFKKSRFLDSNVLCQSDTLPCVVKVIQYLGLPLVDLPTSYRSHLHMTSKTLTEAKFIDTFFENLSRLEAIKSERNKVVRHILESFGSQYDNSTSLCQLLRRKFEDFACIPCGSDGCVLRKCEEVIDPTASFAGLFDESDNRFPIPALSSRALVTTALHHAGIMHNRLSWNLVLERAESVTAVMKVDSCKALERVRLILRTISTCVSGMQPERIASIPFLPVLRRPEDYPGALDWYGDYHQLLPGEELVLSGAHTHPRDISKMMFAGSQAAFVCEELPKNGGCGYIYHHETKELLKLKSSPTLGQVIAHLKLIIQKSDKLDSKWVSKACAEVYGFIEGKLGHSDDAATFVGEELQDVACVWNGSKFLAVNSVANSWKLKNGPYLFTTPPTVSSREKLSQVLGIREMFTCRDAQLALEKMKSDFQEKVLDDSCVELVTELISIFKKSPEDAKDLIGLLYLPDTNNVLHKSRDLVYNDAPWAPIEKDCRSVSRDFPRDLALMLGVKAVRSKLLDQYVSKKFKGVPFGQHEELTRRIHNIIRDYPFDITVLKELLQNADDAKAKKMYIILDKRTHGKESVLSEEWQALQGPALLVWNDSTFSEKDLEGIQELGLGSKRSEAETIGQYGIGFNVVYHLTDCPSFVTNGDTLCVLDPHCRYVPEANKLLPGGRYDNLKNGFWSEFPDMGSAYLQKGVENLPEELHGGSLFRLPIRHSDDMVNSSRIIDTAKFKPLVSDELEKLLDKIMPDMKQAMFFLNNVTEIKFLVINTKANDLLTKCQYKTEVINPEIYEDSRKSLSDAVKGFTETSNCKSCVSLYSLSLTETDQGGKKRSEKWLVQQGVGDIYNEGEFWQFVETAKPKHGIAASLDLQKDSRVDGWLFCFLPLPVKSGVPVHVNGSFVLNSSRRGLWTSSIPDGEDDRSRWNSTLFKAIASSYAKFLIDARDFYLDSSYKNWTQALQNLRNYYSLFPGFHSTDVNKIACMVYKILIKQNAEVVCVIVSCADKGSKLVVEWQPLNALKPEDQVYFWSVKVERKIIHPILQSIGMKISPAPPRVMDCFNYVIGELNSENKKKCSKKEEQQTVPGPIASASEVESKISKIPSVSSKSVFEYYTKHSEYSASNNMQPLPISETFFHTKENFSIFTKFLLGISLEASKEVKHTTPSTKYGHVDKTVFYFEQQSTVQLTNRDESTDKSYPDKPFSHFLLLSADGVLRMFDADNKVFNSKFVELFPKQHLDKFLHPSLRALNLNSSYFIMPDDEDKQRILGVIDDLLSDTLPPELHHAEFVSNSPTVIESQILKKYWECFHEDKAFAKFLPDFLKNWALLLTTDKRLFSTSSEIVPVFPSSDAELNALDFTTKLAYAVITSLMMPFLDTDVVVASVCCPHITDYNKILSNVYHINFSTPLLNIVSNKRLPFLVNYFSIDAKPNDSNWVKQIRSLPFFEDVSGNYQPIGEPTKAVIWPDSASAVGYSCWIHRMNRVFVKSNGIWLTLGSANQLSIESISVEELYTSYIFPNFHQMNEEERYSQLMHIRDVMYPSVKAYCTREDLDADKVRRAKLFKDALTNLECIGPDSERLEPISAFCAHTVKVFSTFNFKTLPERLCDDDWLEFFKELRLKVKLTQKEYLKLCNRIASGEVKAIKECSSILFEYIFSKDVKEEWCRDSNFLQQVSSIPFACSVDLSSVEWIMPGACQVYQLAKTSVAAYRLVKLNGAASSSLKHLLWTVCPLVNLPKVCGNDIETFVMLKGLNIKHRRSLEVSDVMTNIDNISRESPYANESLFNNYPRSLLPPDQETLLDVMRDNFSFLNSCCRSGSSVVSLSNCSCIPVYSDLLKKDCKKMVLVKPSCVLTLTEEVAEFHPHLHELPQEYNNLVKVVLQEIGVRNSLEVHHMQIILQAVYEKCNGMKLDPNSMLHVRKAVSFLGRKMVRNDESLATALDPLYLPDTQGELKLSTSMLYADSLSYCYQIQLDLTNTTYSHFNIKMKEYGIEADKFCWLLPDQIRPLGISKRCRQVPAKNCQVSQQSELSLRVQSSVNFEDNSWDVVKLVNKIFLNDADEVDLRKCIARFFSSLSVVTMQELSMSIILKECETVIGSVRSRFHLAIESADSKSIMYIDSDFEDEYDVFSDIAKHLCSIIFKKIPFQESLNEPEELITAICKYLMADLEKKNKVLSRYECEIGTARYPDHFEFELGVEIPESFHHRLDQDPHNIFNPMEYAGYEEREGCIRYVQVIYLLDDEPENELKRRYFIHITKDDETGKEVSVLDLYKFILGSKVNEEKALVPYADENPISLSEGNLADIKEHILRELKEIWKLDQDLQKKAVRRLYLKWHPDKNLDDPERAQEVFVFLMHQLESHSSESSEDEDDDVGVPRSRGSGGGGWGVGLGSFFNRWDRMAHTHRNTSNLEDEHRAKHPTSASPFGNVREDRRPEEGRRWVEQAEIDYSVLCDIHSKASTELKYGHVCFLAHQVAEKALKGGVYALCGMDGRGLTDHNLTRHAYALQTSEPEQTHGLAQHCKPLESHYLDTRYPNRWQLYTDTPSHHYTQEGARRAKESAKTVLEIVKSVMPQAL